MFIHFCAICSSIYLGRYIQQSSKHDFFRVIKEYLILQYVQILYYNNPIKQNENLKINVAKFDPICKIIYSKKKIIITRKIMIMDYRFCVEYKIQPV